LKELNEIAKGGRVSNPVPDAKARGAGNLPEEAVVTPGFSNPEW